MELLLKTDLKIGQTLYYLEYGNKTAYKPCPACDNKRQVSFEHNGHTFVANCPRCMHKQIKGDESNSLIYKEYSVASTKIVSFQCEDEKTFTINGYIDIEALIALQSRRWDSDGEARKYYISEDEANQTAKALNKAERQRAKDFVKGVKDA